MATSATTGVSSVLGAALTALDMPAAKKPDRSATPAPSITTSTYPSGWKCVNVAGISTHRRWIFSALSRLTAWMMLAWPVASSTAVG